MSTTPSGALLVTTAAIEPTDTFIAGLRFSQSGALRVTTDPPSASDPVQGGWKRTNEGVAYVELETP